MDEIFQQLVTGPCLAQLAADGWLNAVVQLGCLGIVAFGAHYVLTRTIPSQQQVFLEELRAQRLLHHETETASEKAFLGELNAQRSDFRMLLADFHSTNKSMQDRLHELTIAIISNRCPMRPEPPHMVPGPNTPRT